MLCACRISAEELVWQVLKSLKPVALEEYVCSQKFLFIYLVCAFSASLLEGSCKWPHFSSFPSEQGQWFVAPKNAQLLRRESLGSHCPAQLLEVEVKGKALSHSPVVRLLWITESARWPRINTVCYTPDRVCVLARSTQCRVIQGSMWGVVISWEQWQPALNSDRTWR